MPEYMQYLKESFSGNISQIVAKGDEKANFLDSNKQNMSDQELASTASSIIWTAVQEIGLVLKHTLPVSAEF